MPWRSPSSLRSKPGAAARQAPFAGGRLLTVMMPRGYYRPQPADGDSLRISLAGPPWMTGLRRPTWTPPWLNPAITGRWRSGQDFPRWIALGDRFTAANLNPALARPGQLLPSNLKKAWSFERQVNRPEFGGGSNS